LPLVVALASLAGCASLSGLDQLDVCDACSSGDDATIVDGGQQGDTATTPDTSTPVDASHDTSTPPQTDASDAGLPVEVSCFQTKCQAGQLCCLNANGTSATCHSTCEAGTYELDCTLPSDCPNTHCCAKMPEEQVTGASCLAQCENIICVGAGGDSGCPSEDTCTPMGNLPPGYGICF